MVPGFINALRLDMDIQIYPQKDTVYALILRSHQSPPVIFKLWGATHQ